MKPITLIPLVLLLSVSLVDQTQALVLDKNDFFDATNAMTISQSGESVILTKTIEGDAWVRWSVDGKSFVPIDHVHNKLAIVFGELDRAKVEVRFEFTGKGPASNGAGIWLPDYAKSGPVILDDLRGFAAEHKAPGADSFRLFFRIRSGKGAQIPILNIIFGAAANKLTQKPTGMAASATSTSGIEKRDFVLENNMMKVSKNSQGISLEKVETGDAFVAWMPNGKLIDLDQMHDKLVLDFGDFDKSRIQVLIHFSGKGEQASGVKQWLNNHDTAGRSILTSVREFANLQGLPNAQKYRVIFRIQSGLGAVVNLHDIQILKAGTALPKEFMSRQNQQDVNAIVKTQKKIAPKELTPLEMVKVSIQTDTNVQVLDANSNSKPIVILNNSSGQDLDIDAEFTFCDYDDQIWTLKHTFHVPAGGEDHWPLPRDRFQQGYWYVDYVLKSQNLTHVGQTRMASTVIPGIGKFDLSGYNYGICWDDDPQDPSWNASIDMFKVTGADHARMHWKWESAQPNPDRWEFSKMDRIVNATQNAGIEILHILCYNTPWAVSEEVRRKNQWRFEPPDLNLWKEYVTQMVKRYPRINCWEIWNEPDLTNFWQGDTQQYLDLLKLSYKTIKAIDPDDTVTTGGFALLNPHGGRKHVKLQHDVVIEGRPYYDIWATHMHGPSNMFIEQIEGPMKAISNDLTDKGIKDVPVWFTETAIQANNGEWNQAEEMICKMVYARSTGAIGYTWFKDKVNRRYADRVSSWGLMTFENVAKPSMLSYNTTVRYLGDRTFENRLDLGVGNYGFLFGPAKKDGTDRLIVTWSAHTQATRGVWTALVPSTSIITAIDAMGRTQNIPVINGRMALPVTSRPTFLLLENVGDQLNVEPATLQVPGPLVIYPGGVSDVKVLMHNSQSQSMKFTLDNTRFNESDDKFSSTLTANATQTKIFSVFTPKQNDMRFGDIKEYSIFYNLADQWQGELRVPMLVGAYIPKGDLQRDPDFNLDDNSKNEIINLFSFDPRSNHLVWNGVKDISVKIWLQCVDQQAIRMVAVVRDDIHKQIYPVKDAWKGDSIQMALTVPGHKGRWQFTISQPDHAEHAETYVRQAPLGMDASSLHIQATAKITDNDHMTYDVLIPLKQLGLKANDLWEGIRMNVVVNDLDTSVREGWAQIAPGIADNGDEQNFPMVKFGN